MPTFEASVDLPHPREHVFGYHARPAALDRLLPPRTNAQILQRPDSLAVGSVAILKVGFYGLTKRWEAEHISCEPPAAFVDVQRSGPLASWRHEHLFEQTGETSCRLIDRIAYRVSRVPGIDAVGRAVVASELESMFAYRHRVIREDLRSLGGGPNAVQPKKIAVSGSSGLIGQRLVSLANVAGIDVVCLRRVRDPAMLGELPRTNERHPYASQTPWHVETGQIRPEDWSDVDALIHLAGENIAGGRWTSGFKQQLYRSRVDATQRLIGELVGGGCLPGAIVTASGAGIYPSSGERLLEETDPAAGDFLGTLAAAWEGASAAAATHRTRWCAARLGMVLDPRRGALVPLLWQTRLFAAGRIGGGDAYWSWIERDDAAAALLHLASTPTCNGAYNVSGQPETNRDFIDTLAEVLRRPAWLAAPAAAVRLAAGELADGALLRSNRLDNTKLTQSGYRLRYPRLDEALRHLLT